MLYAFRTVALARRADADSTTRTARRRNDASATVRNACECSASSSAKAARRCPRYAAMQSSTEISAQPSPDRSQIERLTPASTRLPQAAAPGTGAGVTQPDQINGEDAGKGAMRPVNCDECIVRQISAVGRASERAPQLKTVFEIHCRQPRAETGWKVWTRKRRVIAAHPAAKRNLHDEQREPGARRPLPARRLEWNTVCKRRTGDCKTRQRAKKC